MRMGWMRHFALAVLLSGMGWAGAVEYNAGDDVHTPITGSAVLEIRYGPTDAPATQWGGIAGLASDELTVSSTAGGTLNLRGDNTGFTGDVLMRGGVLNVTENANLFGAMMNLRFLTGAGDANPAGIEVQRDSAVAVDGAGGGLQRMTVAAGMGGFFRVGDGAVLSFLASTSTGSGGAFDVNSGARLSFLAETDGVFLFDNNVAASSGGAIYNNGGTVRLENAGFTGNQASRSDGGAVYTGNGAVFSHDGGTYTGNQASWQGGAIRNNGGGLDLDNLLFLGNKTATSSGGAIASTTIGSYGTTASIVNSVFESNTAGDAGGAVFYKAANANISAVFEGSGLTFGGNRAQSGDGGAIRSEFATMKLEDSSFTGNNAYRTGGAISTNHILTVTGGEFADNYARSHGGAVYGYYTSSSRTSCSRATRPAPAAGAAPSSCRTPTCA